MFALKNLVRTSSASLLALAAVSGAAAQYTDAPAADPGTGPNALVAEDTLKFQLDRSPGIVKAGCLPNAAGQVVVKSKGPVEVMEVSLSGLPTDIELDAFVIQVPNAPFGLSWYQGDIETDEYGNAKARFIGRFNEETFIVAPGVAPAPQIHGSDTSFPDAQENPATAPVHTFHIGIWFNSPEDAAAAGCPNAVTPFNGEHHAGVQLFNTASFPDQYGPLRQLKP